LISENSLFLVNFVFLAKPPLQAIKIDCEHEQLLV